MEQIAAAVEQIVAVAGRVAAEIAVVLGIAVAVGTAATVVEGNSENGIAAVVDQSSPAAAGWS